MLLVLFFFFKQKTAYEMRISDWSSDVCSSDLEIIAELSVDDAARNLLVIDAPGQAGALLGNVSIAALHFFSDVIVRSAVEPLYAGDMGMQELLDALLRLGFESTGDDPEAIYPLAATVLRRDDAKARLLDLDRKRNRLNYSPKCASPMQS